MKKHQHYFKNVKHLDYIDVYRVLDLFGVTDAALGHAAKKILCAGIRGAKDQAKDVQEAIDTLQRWQEMQAENMAAAELFHKENPRERLPDWQDKELPSSGIYGNEGYTKQDLQAASLVHDAETFKHEYMCSFDPDHDLVSLCAKTEIHADKDGWIAHHGNECPLSDKKTLIHIRLNTGSQSVYAATAGDFIWDEGGGITHWRYHKEQ